MLSRIATPDNVSTILREFQTYVKDGDDRFVREAIQSVGRIATALPDVADRCLRGLMGLINTSSAVVVAAAIVVVRQLLQQHPQHVNIIVRLAKKLSETAVPQARAAIVWIIGEFQSQPRVAHLAPDTLRLLAKGFMDEHVVVKNQILNLAVRRCLLLRRICPHLCAASSRRTCSLQCGCTGQTVVEAGRRAAGSTTAAVRAGALSVRRGLRPSGPGSHAEEGAMLL